MGKRAWPEQLHKSARPRDDARPATVSRVMEKTIFVTRLPKAAAKNTTRLKAAGCEAKTRNFPLRVQISRPHCSFDARNTSRILERPNYQWLMNQVLPSPHINHQLVSPFKDSRESPREWC